MTSHVVPKLLRSRRIHSANMPIPPGLVPVAGVHPESPMMDTLGTDRDFDLQAVAAFQQMQGDWGDT